MVHDLAPPWIAVPVVGAVLAAGVYLVGVLDVAVADLVAGRGPSAGRALLRPVHELARELRRRPASTERPDLTLWSFAPAAYGALAGLALSVIPLSAGFAVADVRTGIVVFGAAEVLLMVAVYLHGWSANSLVGLIGAYRFVAQGLSFMLLEMFVLIGVALPARSLSVGEIVEAQAGLWNAVRHPLALPLWLVVALGAAFWGPLNLADGTDLAGGTGAEVSGPQRVAWQLARRAVLVTYAVMGASAFLGGYLGPWLPGPLWLALKTLAIVAVLVTAGHLVGRIRPERFVRLAWLVLLPLAFVDLAVAGLEAL